ncbi:MAG: hypothetical protein BGN88_06055 [Clostridiales bacterium 43-6]|nr:MAG: hypothetical protein BGN88_06055 [Clostridiales bacterium 43-6]
MAILKKAIGVVVILAILMSIVSMVGVFAATSSSTLSADAIKLFPWTRIIQAEAVGISPYGNSTGYTTLSDGNGIFGAGLGELSLTSTGTAQEHQFGIAQWKAKGGIDAEKLGGQTGIEMLVNVDATSISDKIVIKLVAKNGVYVLTKTVTKGTTQLVQFKLADFALDGNSSSKLTNLGMLDGGFSITDGWTEGGKTTWKAKFSDMYIYGGGGTTKEPTTTLPGQTTTAFVEPEDPTTYRPTIGGQTATTAKPITDSKRVVDWSTFMKTDKWWTNGLKTKGCIVKAGDTVIADADGNTFPADWSAYRVENKIPENKDDIELDKESWDPQFQVGWNGVEPGVMAGADGLRSYILLEPASKQNEYTMKIAINAADENGNPIMAGNQVRVDTYALSTKPSEYTRQNIVNDDMIYEIYFSFDKFVLQESRTDVPKYLNNTMAGRAVSLTVSFGYYWDSMGPLGNRGPLGYISDIWTYKTADVPALPTEKDPVNYELLEALIQVHSKLPGYDIAYDAITNEDIDHILDFFNAYNELDLDTRERADLEPYYFGEEYNMYYMLGQEYGFIVEGEYTTQPTTQPSDGNSPDVDSSGMAPIALFVVITAAGVVLVKSKKKEQ